MSMQVESRRVIKYMVTIEDNECPAVSVRHIICLMKDRGLKACACTLFQKIKKLKNNEDREFKYKGITIRLHGSPDYDQDP